MDLLVAGLIVVAVLGAISVLAYLRRIAAAAERQADALEKLVDARDRSGPSRPAGG